VRLGAGMFRLVVRLRCEPSSREPKSRREPSSQLERKSLHVFSSQRAPKSLRVLSSRLPARLPTGVDIRKLPTFTLLTISGWDTIPAVTIRTTR
jgi:hypothetical protein